MTRALTRNVYVRGWLALFLLLSAVYCFSIGLRASRGASITGDEPFYLITTQSLLDDRNLDLRAQYESGSYRSFFDHPYGLWTQAGPLPDGSIVSPHEPGLSVLVIPGFVLGGLAGVQVQLLLVAAATFAFAYVLTALETRAPLLSWLATAAVGLTATAFVYATEVYPEVPAAFCLVLALLLLRRSRGAGIAPAVAMALLAASLAWLGMKYIPLAALVGGFFLLAAAPRGRLTLLGLSTLAGAGYLGFHLAVFGHLTAYNVNTVYDGASTAAVVGDHLEFGDRVYRTWGLFIDQRFGLGRWAPVLLLVPPALPLLALQRGYVCGALSVSRLVLLLVLTQVAIATFVAITMMGWWFPGRTMMTVLPLFPLALTLVLQQAPRAVRVLASGLSAVTVLHTLLLARATASGQVTLAVDPFDMPSSLFQAGKHLFPSYISWAGSTWPLTLAWLALALVATALVLRPHLAGLLRRGRAGPEAGGTAEPVRATEGGPVAAS